MEALENGEGGRKLVRRKLTVEDYLDFIDDRTLHLKVNQLRQIISMHGFKKIEAHKSILNEMVTTMELMDLHRSTLLDGGVSGDARLTLEEVINDLKSLDWRDCHVTSLLAYGAGGAAPSTASDRTISRKRKRARPGKKAVKGAAVGTSAISTNSTTIVAGSTTEKSVYRS